MTQQTPPTEENPAPEEPTTQRQSPLKFKKKRYFPADKCGMVGCSRDAEGYICAPKPTGKDNPLWFGPACRKCPTKLGYNEDSVVSLAYLAHQRNGASDLALVLDVEVGEVLKRLAAEGIDQKGQPRAVETTAMPPQAGAETPTPEPVVIAERGVQTVEAEFGEDPVWPTGEATQPAEVVETAEGSVALTVSAVHVPVAALTTEKQTADALLATVRPFFIASQAAMDAGAALLADVKGVWKRLDTERKDLGRPLRERLQLIQEYYVPVLDVLKEAEGLLKTRMQEGETWAKQAQAAALVAAQSAYQSGDPAATAQATQAAIASEVMLPRGVTQRTIKKWEIVDASQVPLEMYSIDPRKIQSYVDAGYTEIPGVRVYEEPQLASVATKR